MQISISISLIEVADLKVTNPEGKVFQFDQVGSSLQLHLIIHNSNTYDRILMFSALWCRSFSMAQINFTTEPSLASIRV